MYAESTLPNGLRVASHRREGAHAACLGIWIDVGSRDEPAAQGGISHALEHMLFKGTARRSAQAIAEEFDAVGGQLDAFTDREATTFYATVLPEDLPLAMEILGDMLTHPLLDAQEWRREQDVLLEEERERADSPEEQLHDAFMRACWPAHPLGRPVSGSAATISALTPAELGAFHAAHYSPPRLIVAGAGALEHDRLLTLARDHFEAPAGDAPRREPQPATLNTGALHLSQELEQVHFCLGAPGLSLTDNDRFALYLLDLAVGGSSSSRLFQQIREQRGLCYSIGSELSSYREGGLWTVSGSASPSHAEAALDLARQEMQSVARNGIDATELERARRQVRAALLMSLDAPGSWLAAIGHGLLFHGRYRTPEETLARYEAVTLDDCRRVAERCLGDGATMRVTLGALPGA